MAETYTRDGELDAVVVGGGIAGLTAAALLARAGRSVALFERAKAVGGRAATTEENGFALNLGPHALYERGAALAALRELGVDPAGGRPGVAGSWLVANERAYRLPGNAWRLLASRYLSVADKVELARLLTAIPHADARALVGEPFSAWLARSAERVRVRALVAGLARLSTYTADLDRLDAGAAVAQIGAAVEGGVRYVDGGWRTIVDAARGVATAGGATIEARVRATSVERRDGGLAVRLSDGRTIATRAAVLAVSPADAAELLPSSAAVASWSSRAIPVRAATLDLGLAGLPRRDATFALGVDRADYLSVHSASARLAPEGAAVVHAMRYLPTAERAQAREVECELETLLDLVQPGWRGLVAVRRFLPEMTVSHALVSAEAGGLAGRPGPDVPDAPGVFVAGDWVGGEGMLADAAVASGRLAAGLASAAVASAGERVLEASAR